MSFAWRWACLEASILETQAMFELLDIDRTGNVSFEEFHQWWTNMYIVDRWETATSKDVSGVRQRVDVDWRWRGDFSKLEVLPDLPTYEPDPRTQPEEYKELDEAQIRISEENCARPR